MTIEAYIAGLISSSLCFHCPLLFQHVMRFNLNPALALFVAFSCVISIGCSSTAPPAGKPFHNVLPIVFDPGTIDSVGVYVFSDNVARTGLTPYADSLMGQFPAMIDSASTLNCSGLREKTTEYLARAVRSKLEERGYIARIVTDVGPAATMSLQQCIQHGREQGFDAVFIVNYVGYKDWITYHGVGPQYHYTSSGRGEVHHPPSQIGGTGTIDPRSAVDGGHSGWVSGMITTGRTGYLYIPNAALFDTKTGEALWTNMYYGFDNVGNFVPESLCAYGDTQDSMAAPGSADMLFIPMTLPPGTMFTPLPRR